MTSTKDADAETSRGIRRSGRLARLMMFCVFWAGGNRYVLSDSSIFWDNQMQKLLPLNFSDKRCFQAQQPVSATVSLEGSFVFWMHCWTLWDGRCEVCKVVLTFGKPWYLYSSYIVTTFRFHQKAKSNEIVRYWTSFTKYLIVSSSSFFSFLPLYTNPPSRAYKKSPIGVPAVAQWVRIRCNGFGHCRSIGSLWAQCSGLKNLV